MKTIQFIVHGKPATAGSKRSFAHVGKDGVAHSWVAPANERQKPFMAAVAAEAAAVAEGHFWRDEPLKLEVVIIRSRPKSHFRSGKNAHLLKESAEYLMPTSKPDSLKVCRAIEDALSGVLYRDDSQICWHGIAKMYGESDCTIITVSELGGEEEKP